MTAEDESLMPLLTFCWGEKTYAVPLTAVREVTRLGRVTPVPGGSPTVIGAIVLHGEVLPVVDVRGVLGLALPPEDMNAGNVIIVRDQSNPADLIGLYVDAIGEVLTVREDQIRAQGGDARSPSTRFFIGQIQSQGGGIIRIVHLPQVLDAL